MPKDFICLTCAEPLTTFLSPCLKCGSRMIYSIHLEKQQHGAHWLEMIKVGREKTH